MSLLLAQQERAELWRHVAEVMEDYAAHVEGRRVTPELAPAKIRSLLNGCNFEIPVASTEAIDFVVRGLLEYQTHTPHPNYFGLFNPAPTTMGIAADALVAAFNPQLAAWSHSPFAAEIEMHLIRCFGEKFGYDPAGADGTFCSGGAEANHTALLTALSNAFPEYAAHGARALAGQPVFYVSSESHHSFVKAARVTGIGLESLRHVPVDSRFMMKPEALAEMIENDRRSGLLPFLVVATAGSTNAGVIDPLPELAAVTARENLWLHADAAWGGAAALVPELKPLLTGFDRADSITFDAHKWLSVPMGAGIYLTRHPDILDRTFRTQTSYMPREAASLEIVDPHLHTMQWSRRFTGLKVFLSLLVAGWDGYVGAIRHQTAMGELLRSQLKAAGWRVENDTVLPVVCFTDPAGADPHAIVMDVVSSGEAWISTTQLAGKPVARACITNYRTEPRHVAALVDSLSRARERCNS